ncbi:MAG: hypothetical protein AB7V18_04805 [Pyrinomonadaceae bacterium]
MSKVEAWKNFNLGEELGIAGVFLYNGLRRFHDMRALDYDDEIFEVLYNLAVGLERVFKIAIVLAEHDVRQDQRDFEQSLYTHSHAALFERLSKQCKLDLVTEHIAVLHLLTNFYTNFRYGRFSLDSVYDPAKEQRGLFHLLNHQLGTNLERDDSIFIKENKPIYRKHLTTLILKIARELYAFITDRAMDLRLNTYELRYDSKASRVFQRDPKTLFLTEELAWKELLLFLMNSTEESGALEFLRGLEPLGIDPAMVPEYLEGYGSRPLPGSLIDEVDSLYDELDKVGERLKTMELIGNPNVGLDEVTL